MLVEYIKNKSGNRIGVVVAIDKGKLGYSLRNALDKWNRKKALLIAEGRAKKGNCNITEYREVYNIDKEDFINKIIKLPIYNKVHEIWYKMEDRAQRYFKDQVTENNE